MNLTRRAAYAVSIATAVLIAAAWSAADRQSQSSAPSVAESTVSSSADSTIVDVDLDLPTWQTMEIVDVDGESFTLADYIGTPVLVETFATWCSNCRAQLGDTQEAAAALGEEAVVIALSVETSLSSEEVAGYAADNGFVDIRFAVMSPELLAEFAGAFGTTVANPPSTPKFVIDARGAAGELTTGPEGVEDIVANMRAAGPPVTPATTDEVSGTIDSTDSAGTTDTTDA